MPNPNQANLPVTKREKELLDYAKHRYEQTHGRTDWGGFAVLGALALLAGIGIGVALAQRQEHSNSISVTCPYCNRAINILIAGDRLPVAGRYICPHQGCGQEFIVRF